MARQARTVAAVFTLVLLVPAGIASAEVTVAEYRKMRNDPVVTLYLSGVIQGLEWYDAAVQKNGTPRVFCAPGTPGLNRDRYVKTLDNFLEAPGGAAVIKSNPPIGNALMLAMTQAFPCPKKP